MREAYSNYPKQRISYSKKIANDKEWAKSMVDTLGEYYQRFSEDRGYSGITDYHRMLSNYRLYNNELDQEDFSRELDLLGVSEGEAYQDKIQPYNKSYNKINVLLGEEKKRPFNYKAVLANEEGYNSYIIEKQRRLKEFLNAEVQRIKAQMLPPDIPREQRELAQQQVQEELNAVIPPERLEKYMNTSYLDAREITMNKLLKFLVKKEEILDKKNDNFKHALISAKEFSYVGVNNGKPYVEVLNPLYTFYHKSPETKFIEDGLFAGYVKRMHPHEILDRWRDKLKDKDIKKLEDINIAGRRGDIPSKKGDYRFLETGRHLEGLTDSHGSYGREEEDAWEVLHVEWRSERKIGFLTYLDEMGQVQETYVNEGFKLIPELGHINIEWEWIPEIWEGVRIGDDIYVDLQPKPNQPFNENDPYKKARLGYHGVIYSNMNANPVSLMDRMKPYQFLFFVVMHKLQKMIAQDRGKVLWIDRTLIDKKLGLKKTLYYLENMNIKFYNSLQDADVPGAAHRGGPPSDAMDASNAQIIMNYIALLDSIDYQIGEVAGVTREREGQTSSYDAVSNVQQNIIQSSYITNLYFDTHNKHWERVLSSLLDLSTVVYSENPETIMWLDGNSRAVLSAEDLSRASNEEYGLFLSDTPRDSEIYQNLTNLTQAMVQNDKANISDIIKVLRAESIEEAQREIEAFERAQQAREEAMQKAEQEHTERLQQMQIDAREDEQDHEMEKIDREAFWRLREQEIESMGFAEDKDINNNQVPDVLEVEKLRLEEKKLNQESQNKEADRRLKEKELENKKQIEKMKIRDKKTSPSN